MAGAPVVAPNIADAAEQQGADGAAHHDGRDGQTDRAGGERRSEPR